MTDERVDFTYEVSWYVFNCGPVAGCRWSIRDVEDVHGWRLGAGVVMRLEPYRVLLLMFQNLVVWVVGSDCRLNYERTGCRASGFQMNWVPILVFGMVNINLFTFYFFPEGSLLVEHDCRHAEPLTETPIAIATDFLRTLARMVIVDMALPIICLGFQPLFTNNK